MTIKVYPPEWLFPTKLLISEDKTFPDWKEDLVKWLDGYKNCHDTEDKSNVGGYQSPDNFYLEESFAPFLNRITEQVMITVEEYLHDKLALPKPEQLSLDNMWFNLNYQYSYNVTHCHPGCILAGVFWVQTVEDSEIKFECYDVFGRSMLEKRTHDGFEPHEGQMCIFPAHLPHMVQQNKTDRTRISISFNIAWR